VKGEEKDNGEAPRIYFARAIFEAQHVRNRSTDAEHCEKILRQDLGTGYDVLYVGGGSTRVLSDADAQAKTIENRDKSVIYTSH
jgi:hypothetical protein